MRHFLLATCALLLAGAPAQAGGLFGSSKDRHDKHCDGSAVTPPLRASLRCRMEAPLAPGETQIYIFMGHKFIHQGSAPPRG